MTLQHEPTLASPLRIALANCRLDGEALAPSSDQDIGGTPVRWSLVGEQPTNVAGVAGIVERFEATDAGGLLLERFTASRDELIALRMTFRNDHHAAIELQSMVPLHIRSPESIDIPAGPVGDWRVVRAGRQKNDVPGSFQPDVSDIDLEHARIDAAEFKAGSGVQASDLARAATPSTGIDADPYLWIKSRHDDALPALFIGVLGQTEHLTRIRLETSEGGSEFRALSVICEFDAAVVEPGETRSTHWIALYEGADEETLRQRHVDLVAALMNVPTPKAPPSYFCSWYFYGCDFTQADLDENLAGLRERPIPFDIFLIDNGWMNNFGEYLPGDRFPRGMQHAADAIRATGYQPGIWTCPFVVMKDSPALRKYPRLIARDATGQPVLFPYEQSKEYVVDPTSPDAEAYFSGIYTRIRAWGFTAHKFDFLRAITSNPRIRFHDRSMNRAQAYRFGMELLRRVIGEDAYILACGGLFDGSAGLVDGMRVGSDTKGRWCDPNASNAYHRMGYVVRIKQNVMRNHTNRLWHTDPDALQLRHRDEPFRGQDHYFHLCQGSFTDDEAMTIVAHHYLGGGIVCLCERMEELSEPRRLLLRKALPNATPPARVLDFGHAECPTTFLTPVTPRYANGSPWTTLTVCNWADTPVERSLRASHVPTLSHAKRLAAFELVTGTFLGVIDPGQPIALTVPAHGARVIRLAEWDGRSPILLGTDGHLSGGAAELSSLGISADRIRGEVGWRWDVPLRLFVGVPNKTSLRVRQLELAAGERQFDRPI